LVSRQLAAPPAALRRLLPTTRRVHTGRRWSSSWTSRLNSRHQLQAVIHRVIQHLFPPWCRRLCLLRSQAQLHPILRLRRRQTSRLLIRLPTPATTRLSSRRRFPPLFPPQRRAGIQQGFRPDIPPGFLPGCRPHMSGARMATPSSGLTFSASMKGQTLSWHAGSMACGRSATRLPMLMGTAYTRTVIGIFPCQETHAIIVSLRTFWWADSITPERPTRSGCSRTLGARIVGVTSATGVASPTALN